MILKALRVLDARLFEIYFSRVAAPLHASSLLHKEAVCTKIKIRRLNGDGELHSNGHIYTDMVLTGPHGPLNYPDF